MKKLILLCSTAVAFPTAAFAQSTGTQEFEEEKVIVTGTRAQDVGGVQAPDTSKAKAVLTQEFIARQQPGQTILDTINAVPGVSFQNNDAYGGTGGTLSIRGFSADRVSLTIDGIQVNDSGNYAIFSGQQLDPELIEQVNVNLGTTDVDSPTASAVGGTVNLRMRNPDTKFGGRVVGSLGDFDYRRIFAVIDTGEIGPWGTRALFAVSNHKNDNPFNNYGKVDKQQYNAKIYQPIGTNGDFVSVAGHWNQLRNNFFGSVALRNDLPPPLGFPEDSDDRRYDINYPCTVDVPAPGSADSPNSCGSEFDRRYNPANTGNVRVQSRFTLTDNIVLTVDPSYQYVKANGGGTVTAREFGFDINPAGGRQNCSGAPSPTMNCVPGFFAGNPFFGGVDLNGDGDILDQVRALSPSQTQTDRFGVIAGLRWTINDNHTARVSYTLDYAKHRQTGEVGLLQENGEPFDVFPVNDPLTVQFGGVNETIQKRDRRSKAILNRFAAEWRGEFMGDRLTTTVGVGVPFFTRDLNNFCFTSSASGFVECSGQNAALDAIIAANNPYITDPVTGAVISGWAPPGHRKLKYDDILPNLGITFDVMPRLTVFANYSKGLSVPSTDNLYNAFFFPEGSDAARPEPETSNTVDGGLRYRSSKIQAQAGVWMTKFKNRSASAFDPELNANVFRNLGTVDKWGVDGSIAWSPIKQFTALVFGSWNDSKIQDNIQIGSFGAGINRVTDCDNIPAGALASDIARSCAFTSGNREAGAPKYTYGVSAVGTIGPVDLGINAKRTGSRFIFDDNEPVFAPGVNLTNLNDANAANDPGVIFGSTAPAYWLVNLDARLNMKFVGLKETYFQMNVYNLFDKTYVGGFGGGLSQAFNTAATQFGSPPFVQIGVPRTVSGTLNISF